VSAIRGVDDLAQTEVDVQFDRVAASAREITLEVFATDESASVQVRATPPAVHLSRSARPARVFVRCPHTCAQARPSPAPGISPDETNLVSNYHSGRGPDHRTAARALLLFLRLDLTETMGGKGQGTE
jgi:hypothetical protein